MKRRQILVMAVGMLVVLALVLSACGQQAATTTSTTAANTTTATTQAPKPGVTTTATSTVTAPPVTKAVEPVHKVVNPQGVFIPVETKPCAPRLSGLAGKKILYYESEATNMHMPTLLELLKKDYPTATFDVIYTATFGSSTPTADELKHDCVIRGVGW